MYCIKCGKELREGAAFCVNCGTPTGIGNRPATAPDVKTKAIAGQGKKKGAKALVVGILLLCILAAAGTGGWFVFQKLNVNQPDGEISEEKEEEKADAGKVESVQGMPEAEGGEPEGNVPEEASKKEVHTYELIVEDVTWSQAYQNCLDRGGYLVRINSDEEYQAILQQIEDEGKTNIIFWLGGARSSGESQDYRWVLEDGTYGDIILNEEEPYRSYWFSGEPSYSGEAGNMEMYMNMFYVSKEGCWGWNDVGNNLMSVADFYAGIVGYICEYEEE